MDVDPKFREASTRAKKRKTQRLLQRLLLVLGAVVGLGAIGGAGYWLVTRDWGGGDLVADLPEDGQAVQVDIGEASAPPVRAATPFVDIAGDPMILRFEESGAGPRGDRSLAGPPTLDAGRFGPPAPDRLTLIKEPLIVQERQLITALPSSREDFLFFQAQRAASLNAGPAILVTEDQTRPEDVVEVAADGEDDSFGEALGGDGDAAVSYTETRIQNTTSVSFVRSEATRTALYEDIVVRLEIDRSLADVLETNGFANSAARIAAQIAPIIPQSTDLPAGSIVAVRARPSGDALTPLQVSLYGPDGRFGSVAARGSLGFAPSGDPWVGTDLRLLSAPGPSFAPQQDFRLLDAVYSAAIRKGIPTTLVGEMIVMLSQTYDLEAFAAPGDEITLLFAPQPDASGPGRVLFAGINGPSGDMPCYVAADDDGVFSCFTDQGRAGAAGQGGFTTPVQGTLTSKFGPRHHPILKTVRLHAGVDWAAPTGTPIVAALDGEITRAGDTGGGYGNVIYLDHAGGLQSRYAHMHRFADGMRIGRSVRRGEVIGYVGTTGRSTGPHLHFEFRRNGEPLDPFTLTVSSGGSTVVASAGGASQAVEALVNQIIQVESAGNATAKNPLSTATGLGQFIESTWLRMMRDYRPDLHSTMSKRDLLALRTDPTLSREMVTNLARENERFLSSRRHAITPGRLYLAHFLGPGGAHRALSASDGQTVLEVMGAQVVNANPFLRNYSIADLKAWADRKMRGAGSGGGGSTVSAPRPVMTAEMRAFKELVDQMLAETG